MKGAGERGLTLVELLVVLVILGLASSVVLLNAPPSRAAVERDALRFASTVKTALDEMLMTGATYRLAIDATGFGYESYVEGKWSVEGVDRAFQRVEFDNGITATIEFKDAALANARALGENPPSESEEDAPKIIRLDPIGPPATFLVRLQSAEGVYLVGLDADGAVSVRPDV